MFAIGMSVREARERRGLTIADAEAETRIRAKYLRALEGERFDQLPERAYARAFLREYAEFLGLDSEKFLDEFDARFPVVEEEPLVPVGLPRPWRPRHAGAIAVAALLTALAVLGLVLGNAESPQAPPLAGITAAPATHAKKPARPTSPASVKARHRRPKTPTLVLVAARGGCWIEAHVNSRAGALLYRATLEPGGRLRLPARRLWLRIGAPWNLEARLDGRRIVLPSTVGNVVITPRGPNA
jgi:Helix-turn-helix domain